MTSELTAVADAIRANDRFLLVSHENPDGDAFGSITAMKLVLDALGKDSVLYIGGEMALSVAGRLSRSTSSGPSRSIKRCGASLIRPCRSA